MVYAGQLATFNLFLGEIGIKEANRKHTINRKKLATVEGNDRLSLCMKIHEIYGHPQKQRKKQCKTGSGYMDMDIH